MISVYWLLLWYQFNEKFCIIYMCTTLRVCIVSFLSRRILFFAWLLFKYWNTHIFLVNKYMLTKKFRSHSKIIWTDTENDIGVKSMQHLFQRGAYMIHVLENNCTKHKTALSVVCMTKQIIYNIRIHTHLYKPIQILAIISIEWLNGSNTEL